MARVELIEAKRVRVTYVCPTVKQEIEVESKRFSIDYSENHYATIACPLCSSFHEVLL